MIYARSSIEVDKQNYTEGFTFLLDQGVLAWKLDVQVLAKNDAEQLVYGPVIIQVTEDSQHVFEDEFNTEQWLRLGFNSRVYATPITGVRFRIPTEFEISKVKNAKVDFVFYG